MKILQIELIDVDPVIAAAGDKRRDSAPLTNLEVASWSHFACDGGSTEAFQHGLIGLRHGVGAGVRRRAVSAMTAELLVLVQAVAGLRWMAVSLLVLGLDSSASAEREEDRPAGATRHASQGDPGRAG
jgi:hypothetical protein